jgi:Tfp pilus assembly protein PilN
LSTDPLIDDNLICENCHALNPVNAIICSGCGVNLEQYRANAHRFRKRQEESATVYIGQATTEASTIISNEVAQAKQKLRRQILILLGGAALIAVVIIVLGAVYRQRLATEFNQAMTCLTNQDYRCARDGFAAVLASVPDYPEAKKNLDEARYGVATQNAQSGQWQVAVNELNALLTDTPNNKAALSLLENIYRRWLADALSRGDWLTALQLQLQILARFPQTER